MTCSIPGMCSRQPDCHDRLCPGRQMSHGMDDGPQDESEEGRPVPSVTDVEAWPARVLVAAFVLLVISAAVSPLAFI